MKKLITFKDGNQLLTDKPIVLISDAHPSTYPTTKDAAIINTNDLNLLSVLKIALRALS